MFRTALRAHAPRRLALGIVAILVATLGQVVISGAAAADVDPCGPASNAIVCENSKPGTPKSDWFVGGYYGDIEGFGTKTSVQPGEQLDFKIKTPTAAYSVDIVRLGWYQGNGGRRITTLAPASPTAQTQPDCAYDSASGLVDCGNWAVSTTWNVPADAVPGLYVANFIRSDQPGASQFPFVVRSDASHSDIVVQASDQTWQAYNTYGDKAGVNQFSLYEGGFTGSADGRAYKVSFNRPYRNGNTANYYNAEYPLVRWLERNGYDVSYLSSLDTTTNPALLRNHKVFISSGHDEYWNADQRAGVEAARAAGVNMMFLSGNEMFWKTRLEPSIDGTSTANRTMVCYKETKANAKIDPTATWTGTWRDPRFSPPSDGGRPENAVTGTLFEVNGYRNDSIEVPASYGRNRFWRGTPIATATTTTTLPQGTLGYEWDTDPDNGFRPAGAVDLSETTITMATGQFVLLDQGATYGTGTKTHRMVMYRDPTSRALVFGAGTVQWSWGLDSEHLYPNGVPFQAENVTVQQATVNMLADMNAQPASLQAGLTLATASTDTTAPTVAITSPAPGTTVPANSPVTISGTATDVGGVVGSVEISLDNGTTWQRATGLDNWSYSWTPTALGAVTVKVRAADDSANLSAPQSLNLTVGPQQCPCTVFGTKQPTAVDGGDKSAIEVGMKFTTTLNGTVTGVRFYKSLANTGTHTGSLWSSTGALLATGTFTGETDSGWQTLTFATPVAIRSNTTYVVSYTAPAGHYSGDRSYFTGKGAGLAPLTAPASEAVGGQGAYKYGSGFPTATFSGSNYWVDVVFATGGADNTPPTITSTTPAAGATGVVRDSDVTTVFSEPVDPASVQFSLTDPAGTAVPGKITTNGSTVAFTSTALLAANTAFTATITATDAFGNPLAAPQTWTFTTGNSTAPCPCTILGNAQPKTVDANDANNVELGVKITASAPVMVTGVRFYKAVANTGVHTGTLWSSTGAVLATGTFTNETASGWQTLTFATPVQIATGQTYTVSYKAPVGHYSADLDYFTNSGAGRGIVTAPSSAAAGGQDVYRYGGGFPANTFRGSNYYVDVVYDTAGVDVTAPTVTSTTPASGATGVPVGSGATATFSEPVSATSVQMSLTGGGATVPGSVSVAADGRSATFAPTAALAAGVTYTASVRAADPVGNTMPAPTTWTFTTSTTASCPCSMFRPVDAPAATVTDNPIELGMRWKPSVAGQVTAIRFYKVAGDTGTHTGTLWSSTGTVLATGTFTGESASGWQTLQLANPVTVTAGTTYVVSYTTSAGKYGYTRSAFTAAVTAGPLTAAASTTAAPNGVFRYGTGGTLPAGNGGGTNYFADVVFVPSP